MCRLRVRIRQVQALMDLDGAWYEENCAIFSEAV